MNLLDRSTQIPGVWYVRLGLLSMVALILAIVVLVVGVCFDWAHLLPSLGFPSGELSNPWVRTDLAMLRRVCILIATALIASRLVLWRYPEVVARISDKTDIMMSTAAHSVLFMPLCLTTLILLKTVLQLGLYFVGYSAYGADDFARSLTADYWLYYRRFDLGWEGWLGLGGSGWLPFSDYLFGLALAIYRDIYLTPKIVNLALSAIAVVAVYLLGRQLFGRAAGFFAACLFAFQPWHVWLGISGMTSDLSSVVLVALFGVFLVRWLETDTARDLLAAAAFLGVANGFRYENWFFSSVFSMFLIFVVNDTLETGISPPAKGNCWRLCVGDDQCLPPRVDGCFLCCVRGLVTSSSCHQCLDGSGMASQLQISLLAYLLSSTSRRTWPM